MGYYWTYYAASLLAAYLFRNPWALLRIGDDEAALRALAEAVGIDPDAGQPFSDLSTR
jgi:hypothetical protein